MSDHQPIDEMKAEASQKGKNPTLRRWLIALLVVWFFTIGAVAGIAWNAYFGEKNKSQTLAEQIAFACDKGDFGPGVSKAFEDTLCSNAQKVIKNEPEIQEGEVQEPEIQDPEVQDPEFQNPEFQQQENQNPEFQQLEAQDPEIQDLETQDPEIQDEETQDPEVQDEETQDPEIDDPDPASPYVFQFKFIVPGNGLGSNNTTYIVTCNSGTGECTVEQE